MRMEQTITSLELESNDHYAVNQTNWPLNPTFDHGTGASVLSRRVNSPFDPTLAAAKAYGCPHEREEIKVSIGLSAAANVTNGVFEATVINPNISSTLILSYLYSVPQL